MNGKQFTKRDEIIVAMNGMNKRLDDYNAALNAYNKDLADHMAQTKLVKQSVEDQKEYFEHRVTSLEKQYDSISLKILHCVSIIGGLITIAKLLS